MTMMLLFLGIGAFFLPILLHLAIRLRLGVPLLYAVLALTVFHNWTQTYPALANGIFFALVGLAALSWVVTIARKVYDLIDGWRVDQAAARMLAGRARQARAAGECTVSMDDLWS